MEKDIGPKKIHIIGSVGSGKTTLARKLSYQLQIPFHELDTVVWERRAEGDIRRSESQRDNHLQEIVQQDHWIIEGAHHKWVGTSFQKADLIILLDTPYYLRIYRIIRRFFLQKTGREASHYKPTFQILYKMFKWNALFERESRGEIIEIMKEYEEKFWIISNSDDAYLNFENFKDTIDNAQR